MASLLQRLRTYFSDEDLVTITPAMYKAKLALKKEQAEAMARAEEHRQFIESQPQSKELELCAAPRIPKDQFIGPIPQRRNSDHIKFDCPLPHHDNPIEMKFKSAPNLYHVPAERETD